MRRIHLLTMAGIAGAAACVPPHPLELPEGVLAGARSVVLLTPHVDGPTEYQILEPEALERLPFSLPTRDLGAIQALFYSCSPDGLNLREAGLVDVGVPGLLGDGCLPPTDRRISWGPDDDQVRSGSVGPSPRFCSHCALSGARVLRQQAWPGDIEILSGAFVDPQTMLVMAQTFTNPMPLAFRVELGDPLRIVPLRLPAGLAAGILGPIARAGARVVGFGRNRLYAFRIEGDSLLAEELGGGEVPLISASWGSFLEPAQLGDLYFATGYGALWHQEAAGWRELQAVRPESANGMDFGERATLARDENGALVGVGIGASPATYQILSEKILLLEYYQQTATSTSFRALPGRLSAAFAYQGRNHLLTYEGEIYRWEGINRPPVPLVTVGLGNFALAVAGDRRLVLAGSRGGLTQVLSAEMEVCPLIDAPPSAELLVDGRTLYLLSRQDFTIQEIDLPPIVDCGMPTVPVP